MSTYKYGIVTDVLIKMLEEAKQTALNHLNWGTNNPGAVMSGILGAIYDNGFEENKTITTGNLLMRQLLYFHIREAIPIVLPSSIYKTIEDLDNANIKQEIISVFDCAINKAKDKISI